MTDAQRPAAAEERGLLGYVVVEADSPDGSFAYVAYDDVVYRTKAEAWATITDEAMEQRKLRVVAIIETAHWEAAQVTS